MPLPTPAELQASLVDNHAASYSGADLRIEAEDFLTSVPSQRVTTDSDGATFAPNWSETNADFAGLSYAFYSFEIPNYDGNASISYSWHTAPDNPESVYIGFANWNQNMWGWYRGKASGTISFPSLDRFTDFTGRVVVVVLNMGTDPRELDWLRLGSFPPDLTLTSTPGFGVAPLSVSLDAAATDSDGTIVSYEWDPEGDGTFGVDTGSDPHLDWTYETGKWLPRVRATDDDGISSEANTTVSVFGSTHFSLGAPQDSEFLVDVVIAQDGDLIMFGQVFKQGGSFPDIALVTKIAPDLTTEFVREWPSGFQGVMDAAPSPDGSIYTCGSQNIMKWDQQGNVVWQRATAGNWFNSVLAVNDRIYAAGGATIGASTYAALVACFDTAGNLVWARTLGSSSVAVWMHFVELDLRSTPLDGITLECAGNYSEGASPTDADFLQATYDLEGNRLDAQTWGEDASKEFVEGQAVAGLIINPGVFVSGYISPTGQQKGVVTAVGGSSVVFTHPTLWFFCNDLHWAPGGLALLGESAGRDLLMQLGTDLSVGSVMEVVGTAGPAKLSIYGGSHLIVGGSQSGALPTFESAFVDSQAGTTVWTTINPTNADFALASSSGSVVLTDQEDYAFNRASDTDAWLYMQSL